MTCDLRAAAGAAVAVGPCAAAARDTRPPAGLWGAVLGRCRCGPGHAFLPYRVTVRTTGGPQRHGERSLGGPRHGGNQQGKRRPRPSRYAHRQPTACRDGPWSAGALAPTACSSTAVRAVAFGLGCARSAGSVGPPAGSLGASGCRPRAPAKRLSPVVLVCQTRAAPSRGAACGMRPPLPHGKRCGRGPPDRRPPVQRTAERRDRPGRVPAALALSD